MTANQIAFANVQETKRHNLVSEQETSRHNVTTEQVTSTFNRAQAEHFVRQDAINAEHYARMDAETARSHLVGEQISRDTLSEGIRHNQATETETWRHNLISENVDVSQAATSRINAETRESELEETKRHNIENERTIDSTIKHTEADTELIGAKVLNTEASTEATNIDNTTRGLYNLNVIDELAASTKEKRASAEREGTAAALNVVDLKTKGISNWADIVESGTRSFKNVSQGFEAKSQTVSNLINSIGNVLRLTNAIPRMITLID